MIKIHIVPLQFAFLFFSEPIRNPLFQFSFQLGKKLRMLDTLTVNRFYDFHAKITTAARRVSQQIIAVWKCL